MVVIDITSSDSENEEELTSSDGGLALLTRTLPPYFYGSQSQGSVGTSHTQTNGKSGIDTGSSNGFNEERLTSSTRQLPPSLLGLQSQGSVGTSYMQTNGRKRTNTGSYNGSDFEDPQQLFSGHDRGSLSSYKHFQHREEPQYHSVDDKSYLRADDKSYLRAQPIYGQSSAPTNEVKPSVLENGSGGESFGLGSNAPLHQFYIGNDDEVAMYEVPYPRVLPPSFSHGKPNFQPAGLNDGAHHSGEEMHVDNDESLIYQAALQDLSQPKLPETDVPSGLLAVPLLRHQKIALAWMIQKENASVHCLGGFLADDQGLGKTVSTIALIQMQRSLSSKATRDDSHKLKFEPLILDDDDEEDKKVTDLHKETQSVKCMDARRKLANLSSQRCRPAAGTLIVCPASVLRQWARELDEKVAENAKLSVLVYHGSSRTKDPEELAKHDVVLTTYAIVSNEVPKQSLADDDDEQKNTDKYGLSSDFSTSNKRKKSSNGSKKGKKGKKGLDCSNDYDSGALAKVGWFRVVLDEAQTIKNYRTQVARACCGLRAKRRWCLSGTPMQNAIDDLYSYFRFLRYDPYACYKSFCSSIKYPIARNAIHGYKKLQAVLKTMMLRRTKETVIDGEPILKLPPKTIFLKKVEFSPEERDFYTRLEADSRLQFKKYADEGTVKQNYANILLLLLRLRQACDHPILVKGFHSHSTGKGSLQMAKNLPKDLVVNLLSMLEASSAICCVCNDIPDDAIVTMCGHVFCYQCVFERLTGDDNSCSANDCKDQLGPDSIFSRNVLLSCISDDHQNNGASSSGAVEGFSLEENDGSSKIKAAMEILQSVCQIKNSSSLTMEGYSEMACSQESTYVLQQSMHSSPTLQDLPDKVIVFSQWTGMLDLLEKSLENSSIQFRRLDGTMTLASRDKAVKDFTTKPEVTVMIMSLKAGNLGLNLVTACHVIMLDLWWNPTTEDQAVDRAHRIGQTRPVTVSRLTIKDTVEDRILALQEEKRKMVSSAFGDEKGGSAAARLTVEDLRYLFMGG